MLQQNIAGRQGGCGKAALIQGHSSRTFARTSVPWLCWEALSQCIFLVCAVSIACHSV